MALNFAFMSVSQSSLFCCGAHALLLHQGGFFGFFFAGGTLGVKLLKSLWCLGFFAFLWLSSGSFGVLVVASQSLNWLSVLWAHLAAKWLDFAMIFSCRKNFLSRTFCVSLCNFLRTKNVAEVMQLNITSSTRVGQPAELKHINKRRRRN